MNKLCMLLRMIDRIVGHRLPPPRLAAPTVSAVDLHRPLFHTMVHFVSTSRSTRCGRAKGGDPDWDNSQVGYCQPRQQRRMWAPIFFLETSFGSALPFSTSLLLG